MCFLKCASFASKSVTCSTVKSKLVISDVNVIRKNAANDVRDSAIACVSIRLPSSFEPSDFAPQCYSDSFKRSKRGTGKIVSFFLESHNVNSNHC